MARPRGFFRGRGHRGTAASARLLRPGGRVSTGNRTSSRMSRAAAAEPGPRCCGWPCGARRPLPRGVRPRAPACSETLAPCRFAEYAAQVVGGDIVCRCATPAAPATPGLRLALVGLDLVCRALDQPELRLQLGAPRAAGNTRAHAHQLADARAAVPGLVLRARPGRTGDGSASRRARTSRGLAADRLGGSTRPARSSPTVPAMPRSSIAASLLRASASRCIVRPHRRGLGSRRCDYTASAAVGSGVLLFVVVAGGCSSGRRATRQGAKMPHPCLCRIPVLGTGRHSHVLLRSARMDLTGHRRV